MRIKKSTVTINSSSDNTNHLENVSEKSKKEAYEHVKCAINCLTSCAKDDIKAQESLANLSVVALELK